MGYRSEVALAIRKSHEKEMIADPNIVKALGWADERIETADALLFIWSWIKWYEDYDEVASVMKFLNKIEEYDDFLFLRLGEGDEDVETHGGWWDNPFDLEYVRRLDYQDPSNCRSAPRIADLKSRNTDPRATSCAQCGAVLCDPMPGMSSMKHCPKCEP